MERANGVLEARITYAAELFEAHTIARWADQYLRVLHALVSQPQRVLRDFELMSADERSAVLQSGRPRRTVSDVSSVHRLIEHQVRRAPLATALTFRDTALSYGELNRRANRLAHRLIALGVKPETRVGIAMERSIELVVGLLAIAKAGGVYVPSIRRIPRSGTALRV